MTVTGPLVAFLNARLDEDEAAAKAAANADEPSWRFDYQARPVPRIVGAPWESIKGSGGYWDCDDPDDDCWELREQGRLTGEHIARHDPARVLREVEAKRRVLAIHRPDFSRGNDYCENCDVGWPCETAVALAAVYSDHPDYDAEWA